VSKAANPRISSAPKKCASGRLPALIATGGFLLATAVAAQYPGRVKKTDNATPVLRSVAVLEWTGEAGKPSASRLVPVTVYDGEQLNDGTIYLNRPEPMALSGGVEYELQSAGKPLGLFDVFGAGEISGAWQGFGVWKPLSASETARASAAVNTSSLYSGADVPEDDHPVLKRKHPQGSDSEDSGGKTPAASPSTSSNSDSSTAQDSGNAGAQKTPAASDDPDRPTLKRKSSGQTSSSGSDTTSSAGSDSKSSTVSDPDRPTIRRSHRSSDTDMDTSNAAPDPDRPRLKRGKPAGLDTSEAPKLEGMPATMQQAVAVSDARDRAEHPWKYTWANPDDEAKMKEALEAIARTALGLDPPPAKPSHKTVASKTASARKATAAVEPSAPAPLAEEQFRVFELAYGATATLVLTASTPRKDVPAAANTEANAAPKIVRTPGNAEKNTAKKTQVKSDSAAAAAPTKPTSQKFVTLIAQPDLYGGVLVLHKSVTDSAHLDETPRMRLVDAVDAMGDNRGELLFELRGDSQRQFAMYRVLRGSAEQLFATVAIPVKEGL
jgi:hypothetical protein